MSIQRFQRTFVIILILFWGVIFLSYLVRQSLFLHYNVTQLLEVLALLFTYCSLTLLGLFLN